VAKHNTLRKKLGEVLIDSGIISRVDCERLLFEQKSNKKRLGELFVDKGLCTERDIACALSSQLGIPFVDLENMPIEPPALEVIPKDIARKHVIVPLSIEGKALRVAVHDPFALEALDDAQFSSGLKIRACISTRTEIMNAIKKHYDLRSSLESVVGNMAADRKVEVVQEVQNNERDIEDMEKQSSTAPIIRMVNLLIAEAVEQRASDIHLDPMVDKLVVRNRVDGFLKEAFSVPKWIQGAVISRIKIMAEMDIAEKRLPQDGRIHLNVNSRKMDLRVSTLPSKWGEKVVIRLLDPTSTLVPVEQLGLNGKTFEDFISLISNPQGIVLVTGPTGSGKTTTLYTALSTIKSIEKNIITVEDPIEYDLQGATQVAVNEKIGFTFSTALRSILRQDPDVIMIGEMRDLETATIAMQASLTGHLVFSTLHTNDAVATIPRLRNLGIPSFLIASTISGIIAQRLVRVLCPHCKIAFKVKKRDVARLGPNAENAIGMELFKPTGCPKCNNTGYCGRTGIYEMLVVSYKMQDLISREGSETEIRRLACSEGMKTLIQMGLDKALEGVTSNEELLQVIHATQDALPAYEAQAKAVNQ